MAPSADLGVVRHEWRRLIRTRAATNALLGGVGLLATVLVLAWPAGDVAPTVRSDVARALFEQLLRMQLLALGVGAPLLVAGRVAADGSADGWELVRTTPLGLPALVRAKAEAALGLLAVLGLAILPLWGACVLLGGIAPAAMAGAALWIFGALAWFTGAGVLGAALAARVGIAAIAAVGAAVPGMVAAWWALPAITAPDGRPWLTGCAALLVGLVGLRAAGFAAGRRLRAPAPAPSGRGRRVDRRGWWSGAVGRLVLGPRPVAEWPDRGNPFLLRETLADLDPRAASSVGLILLAAVFGVGGLSAWGVFDTQSDAWLVGVVAGSGTLVAMVAAAQMLPTERERGTLDLLRCIPGAAWALPIGKAGAAVRLGARVTLTLGAFALPGIAVHLVRAAISVQDLAAALPHLAWLGAAEAAFVGMCVVGGTGIGVLAGAACRTTTSALLSAAAGLALLMGVPAIVKAIWLALAYPHLSLYDLWTHLGPFVVLTHPGVDDPIPSGATVGPDPGRLLTSAVAIGVGGAAALVVGLVTARRRMGAVR